jgi:hypothetical protein
LVIKDFYNPKNKSLQDLGFIVSQSLRFVTDIDKNKVKWGRYHLIEQHCRSYFLTNQDGYNQHILSWI